MPPKRKESELKVKLPVMPVLRTSRPVGTSVRAAASAALSIARVDCVGRVIR